MFYYVCMQMLDCIEAFHRHGYVHRDIKASNFAMTESTNPAKRCVPVFYSFHSCYRHGL